MTVGLALLTLSAAVVMTLAVAVATRRRRRARALPSGLDLDLSSTDLLPAGLKHLGARLDEPLSLGLRIPPPHAATGPKRLGQLIGIGLR